jgi:hypothetical protein
MLRVVADAGSSATFLNCVIFGDIINSLWLVIGHDTAKISSSARTCVSFIISVRCHIRVIRRRIHFYRAKLETPALRWLDGSSDGYKIWSQTLRGSICYQFYVFLSSRMRWLKDDSRYNGDNRPISRLITWRSIRPLYCFAVRSKFYVLAIIAAFQFNCVNLIVVDCTDGFCSVKLPEFVAQSLNYCAYGCFFTCIEQLCVFYCCSSFSCSTKVDVHNHTWLQQVFIWPCLWTWRLCLLIWLVHWQVSDGFRWREFRSYLDFWPNSTFLARN